MKVSVSDRPRRLKDEVTGCRSGTRMALALSTSPKCKVAAVKAEEKASATG
jgi:hypothetical protein